MEKRVFPSSQVDQILPRTIAQNYRQFVNFMTTAAESTERIGFGQDILQNLDRYRDFDTYKNTLTQSNVLDAPVSIDDEELVLVDSYGFPEENGVILIGQEVILYRKKEGNTLEGLLRGAAGTIELETFKSDGEYVSTDPAIHNKGDEVKNLSVMFLVSMLETIHKSFTPEIDSKNIYPEINRSTLLQNIKDFFQSKGTRLGIESLFRMLFGENDVDVTYPGDRMIKPSTSTFSEKLMMRVSPIPPVVCDLDILETYVLPSELIGQEIVYKSYNDDRSYARGFIDYVSSYTHGGEDQYELWVNPSRLQGEIYPNPRSILTRDMPQRGTSLTDIFTVTVESTVGFPDKGVIFIENEGIYYSSRTFNQFHDCRRGYIGVEAPHTKGNFVYGPYYIEAKYDNKKSRSYPLGLVESVDVRDGGLLHLIEDKVELNGPGEDDPRETILRTIIENSSDELVTLANPSVGDPDYTYGVSGTYFDKKNVYISSHNLPAETIGSFGSDLTLSYTVDNFFHIFPRFNEIRINKGIEDKGNFGIGMFVDGVPAYSNTSGEGVIKGDIAKFVIKNPGTGYITPSVVINPPNMIATPVVENGKIVAINKVTRGDFSEIPEVRITSGEGAKFDLSFDTFGRLTKVVIVDGGQYFNDVPVLQLTDSTKVGKGALMSCKVAGGKITSVTIENTGLDYNPATTTVRVNPVGNGAVIEPIVEQFRYDRVQAIEDSPVYDFDGNKGFLYAGEDPKLQYYAYTVSPPKLREKLGDDGSGHSPILGWAYDGNPIYGPYGYKNRTNDTDGVVRMLSGYKVMPGRNATIPFGYTEDDFELAANPPSESEYPMGTFVEDYIHTQENLIQAILTTEIPEDLRTELEQDILVAYRDINAEDNSDITLDKYNGRICNTPDYPVELYPDGVYCYFLTVDENDEPVFPYIMGRTFRDRPISQVVNVEDSETLTPITYATQFNPLTYESPPLTFDFRKADRYRDPLLSSTKDGVELELGSVKTGSVSGVSVEYGGPERTRVGDILYFDNTDTGGSGASGIVTYTKGEEIVSADGKGIFTYISSKRIKLDLSFTSPSSFVFTPGSYVTFSSGSLAIVEEYIQAFDLNGQKELTVRILNNILPTVNDVFYDNRDKIITFPGNIPIVETSVGPIANPYRNGITTTAEEGLTQILTLQNSDDFFVGDEVFIAGAMAYNQTSTIIEKIEPTDVKIDISGLEVPNGSVVENKSRAFFEFKTATPHRLRVGETIIIEDSVHEELNGHHQVAIVVDEFEFKIYVSQDYDADPGLKYYASGSQCENQAGIIKLISGGIGYKSLPRVVGLIKFQSHRAETLTHVEGTSISSVEILKAGVRYDSPIAVFVDLAGSGSGAEATVTVTDGIITDVTVTNGGEGYEEPILYLVEPVDMQATTETIGEIRSIKVLNPGRAISADRSLKPEIQLPTRLVLKTTDTFSVNETVIQGTAEVPQVIGYVDGWDPVRKILTVIDMTGVFVPGTIKGSNGGTGEIIVNGQAETSIVVNGLSELDGFFIDDTSKISEKYPVIQDSYYFQWFSYVIHSNMQKAEYDPYVQTIIHPAGFIDFGELNIHDRVNSPTKVIDPEFDALVITPPTPDPEPDDGWDDDDLRLDGLDKQLIVSHQTVSNEFKLQINN